MKLLKKGGIAVSEEIVRLHYTEDELRRDGGRSLHQFGVQGTYKIHTHDFYELFLVPNGSAVHVVNGRPQLLTEGSFVLIRPGDIHRYEFFNSDAFEIIDIGIPETLFLRICAYLQVDRDVFDKPPLPLHCVLSGASLSDVQRKLLQSGRMEDREAGYRYMVSVFPYLVGMFLSAPEPERQLPPWLSALLEKMDEPENFIAGLPRLVALANMSQEHLTRSFHRYLGATPTAFINAKRLGLAAELLLTTETPVIDVGGLCGFNSQSRFYRLFTERFGCPPKVFRTQFRDQPALLFPYTS